MAVDTKNEFAPVAEAKGLSEKIAAFYEAFMTVLENLLKAVKKLVNIVNDNKLSFISD